MGERGAMGGCFSCVENGSVGLVTQCGAFKRIATPGFNCICCCTGEMVQATLNLRQQQLNVELETKTKDDVFESKDEIAEKVRMDLSSSMSQFGYVIVNTLVTDIEPAAQVKAAMNEINAATHMRKVAIEKAEAQKTRIVKDAEADAEAKYLAGTGIMRQRQAIVNGLRESVKVFSEEVKDVTSKDVMDMMILTQYFDVLKYLGAGAKSSAVFIPPSPAGVSDVSGAVRNGVLQARNA